MTRPNPMSSGQDESMTMAAKHLPPGAEIAAHVQCGRRLVVAVERAIAPLGWFDQAASESIWHFVQPHAVHGRPYPVNALLDLEGDLVAISDEAIWRYHWAEDGRGPELIQRAQIPRVVGRNLVAAAITPSHLALLTHHISDTQSTSGTIKATITSGKSHRRLTETLLLLDSAIFQELGSAAVEQTWDHFSQEAPPCKWRGIELTNTHLCLNQGALGTIHVQLGNGPIDMFQALLV